MKYRTINGDHMARMRVDRVLELETEHYRSSLRLEDAQSERESAAIAAEVADLEARIGVHVAMIERAPDGEDDSEDDSDPDGPANDNASADASAVADDHADSVSSE